VTPRRGSPYFVLGTAGLVLAVALVMALVTARGLSRAVEGVVVVAAVGLLVALTAAFKVFTGEERLTSYHHQLSVLAVISGLLWVLGRPVLAHADVTMLGVGVFLSFGRVGCFRAGCCYGRPGGRGVRYGVAHADAGFPRCLVGVRLFPVQLVEAAWLALVVLIGAGLVLSGAAPGAALAWYLVAYASGRFVLEFWRGDADRPHLAGFSEAQWTGVGVTVAVAAAEVTGLLPVQPWHLAAALAFPVAMVVVRATEPATSRLLAASHVREVAELLAAGHARALASGAVHVGCTSLGVRVSVSAIRASGQRVDVVALSGRRPLGAVVARRLARLVAQLRRSEDGADVLAGGHDVYHIVLRARAGASEVAHAV
jgi:prolipoprotein diacylglyceryltransferase